jgi:hypothetical protein
MGDVLDGGGVIDDRYLPYTEEQLKKHYFAPTDDPEMFEQLFEHWIRYYRQSADTYHSFIHSPVQPPTTDFTVIKRNRQIERDERFWIIACLVALYEDPDTRIEAFSSVLTRSIAPVPPFEGCGTWQDALGSDFKLFFEANLSAPKRYHEDLRDHLDERLPLIPHIKGTARGRVNLEGATKVDALLIAPDTGFSVLFEAKVLADTSCHIEFDARRNQIARNIDVMLEEPDKKKVRWPLRERVPARSCFVLVTDQMFESDRQSRLYGWLMDGYKQDIDLLVKHLGRSDRSRELLATVQPRLGWLTWQACNDIHPYACRWLYPDE